MDELYHHGVKGQKWGVRRTPAQLGHKVSLKKMSNKERDKYAKARVKNTGSKKKALRSETGKMVRRTLGRGLGTAAGTITGSTTLGLLGASAAFSGQYAAGLAFAAGASAVPIVGVGAFAASTIMAGSRYLKNREAIRRV